MCKCYRNFMESLCEEKVMSKKEFVLILSVGVLAGIVFGFLFSPRKTITVGSNNIDNRGADLRECCEDNFED